MLNALRATSFSYSRFQRVGREFFWVGLGQATAAVGSIVGVRLLTHALPPVVYGELALGMTIATLSQQTVLSPLSGASLRFFAPALEARQLPLYLQGVRKLLARATVLVLAVLVALSIGIWILGHGNWLGLLVASFVFALLSGYSVTLDGMQNAARQRVVVAWHDGLAPWLRFLTAIALVSVLGTFSHVAMLGYALASAMILSSQFWFFRQRILTLAIAGMPPVAGAAEDWARRMYAYAWPLAASGLLVWPLASSDRWALQTFTTTASVGLYAVLYQIGFYPVSLLSGLVLQLVTPILYSRAGNGTDAEQMQCVKRITYSMVFVILGLTGSLALLSAFLHAQIFDLLAAPEYHSVSSFLPFLVISGGLAGAVQCVSLLFLAQMDSKSLAVPRVFASIAGTVLYFVGAYRLGLVGVVLAGVAFLSLWLIWLVWFSRVYEASKSRET